MKDNFYSEYQGSVGRLEESVEEDFINHLKHSCSRERNYRRFLLFYSEIYINTPHTLFFFDNFLGDSMLAKARSFGDRDLFRKAQNINMPSCENLQKYLNT